MSNKDIERNLQQLEESVIHMNDSFKDLALTLNEGKKHKILDPIVSPNDRDNNGVISAEEVRKSILKRVSDKSLKDRNDTEIKKRGLEIAHRTDPENQAIETNLANTNDKLQQLKAIHSNDYHMYTSCNCSYNMNEDLNNMSTQQSRQPIPNGNENQIENLEAAKEKTEEEQQKIEENTKKVKEIASKVAEHGDNTGAIKKSIQQREKRDQVRQNALDQRIKGIDNQIKHQEDVMKQAEDRIKAQQDLAKEQEASQKLSQINSSYSWLREAAYATPEELAFSGQTGLILDIMINNTESDDPAVMDTAARLRDSAMMRNLLFKFKSELTKSNPDTEKLKYLKNQIRKEINNYMKTN